MMPIPSDRSWRMILKSCSDSPAASEDVGSSMMMMRAFKASALAISTICIWPAVSSETGVVGGRSRSDAGEQLPALLVQLGTPERREQPARLAAEEDVRADVEIRREHQLLVDQRDAEALGLAHAAHGDALAIHRNRALGGKRRAAENLHQRALARAVFAH